MRVKDPLSLKSAEISKKANRPKKHRDEDSSDEITGVPCQHVSRAVDVTSVKKAVTQSVWSVCSECLKERVMCDGEPSGPFDVLLCLKCGFQGCNQSDGQHSVKHFQAAHSEPHCIVISLSTWKVWCHECNEELSTHCNKKALAQMVDFLQKHSAKAPSGSSSKIIKIRGETESSDLIKGRIPVSSTLVPVKGLSNLGNTCFFNAVMQNLAQTHLMNDLITEIKEKGSKLKICPSAETNLDPLVVTLPSPEPLTSAMFLFLHSMKEAGKGPISPKILFNQMCQKAPRFKGYQQQDSQELLHYLLDAMRVEETKRIKAGILKAFNNPTEKTADDDTKRQVKAYGKEGVKMNFVDRIFVGELTNTIMCEECEHISTVKEAFIDLSLPIIEERVSKPVNMGRAAKTSKLSERDCEHLTSATEDTAYPTFAILPKNTKKHGSGRDKNNVGNTKKQEQTLSEGERSANEFMQQNVEDESPPPQSKCNPNYGDQKMTINGSHSEISDGSNLDSSNDADSEASESESHSRQTVNNSCSDAVSSENYISVKSDSGHNKNKDLNHSDTFTTAVSKLSLNNMNETHSLSAIQKEQSDITLGSKDLVKEKPVVSQNPQIAFQSLSSTYVPCAKECSIQSCLYQFTSVELLMGNNKLLCENCTEKKQKHQKKTFTSDKKVDNVYTSARKQMLISALPPVVILHLKRFHQAGMTLRKVNRHVDFPLVLDLAPFCSASCKNIVAGEKVLYSLYGIVEHSGSMRGGHYTAYVKIRAPPKKQDYRKHVMGLKEATGGLPGQWVYVSDTHVQAVPESRVLNSQAYLLFYEELL
ncbi:ubiquitin carboxyl-terminal hydrolase 45 isoform X1 [Erpetoichthys calabaricus]|uniref:ubiquitin carboxyl-terminal hydrolase 45 isoform X1 n=2 Tax=Erpetoichthys calabaricus TaxID=27687 RepID=UPI002234A5EC|nr:ubiquitin carboxyl-terminal hydrolase 45 isoform X1 [Erpetoichthys calabaricus]XP_051781460.1 ubiquitin carboxyl-terminal hydrolase 45 isoform X1 [Erpetoichthys calabaricus]